MAILIYLCLLNINMLCYRANDSQTCKFIFFSFNYVQKRLINSAQKRLINSTQKRLINSTQKNWVGTRFKL